LGRHRTGGISRRGNAWRISYRANGVRYFETFETEEKARRELAKRISDDASGIPVSSAPNVVLFGELIVDVRNEYLINKRKSLKSFDARMQNHVDPALGHLRASQITTSQLNTYILRRQAETPKPSTGTINRELEAIRHVFRLAMQGGKLLHMPHVPHLRENNTRTGFFTAADVERLCSHMAPMLGLFVRFAFLTGWRRGEISGLKWSNVDFVANEIRLEPGTTKSGEGRIFPMTSELRDLLTDRMAWAKTPKVKTDKAARRAMKRPRVTTITQHVFVIDGRPVGEFRKQWIAANDKAGLPCVYDKETGKKAIRALRIFHDLRRSAARRFVQAGLSQSHIMALCGWKTDSIFQRYQVVTTSDLRAALDRMEGHAEASASKSNPVSR